MATYIDLFSGCGGLSLGLSSAGFELVAAFESNPDAFETYRTNMLREDSQTKYWPEWLDRSANDLTEIVRDHSSNLAALEGSIDLVAGGPPCQGFSINGRRDPNDPRSAMVDSYLKVVELVRPKFVLLENVLGFKSMEHSSGCTYSEAVEHSLAELGYESWATTLIASDWGVPQRRPRYFCIAAPVDSLKGIDPIDRVRTSRRNFLKKRNLWPSPTTTKDAISDFETGEEGFSQDPEWGHRGFKAVKRHQVGQFSAYQKLMREGCHGEPSDRRLARHAEKTVSKFEEILNTCEPGKKLGRDDRSRLGIGKRSTTPLSASMPSTTVTTLPDDMIHYKEPRTLSVRELARLQSFPDWFSFRGPYTTGGLRRKASCPRFTQVGNAVPPLIAEAIGETLIEILLDEDFSETSNSRQVFKKISSVALEVVNG